ncbi:hypothetical protein D3C77_297500 [compost metagenome]
MLKSVKLTHVRGSIATTDIPIDETMTGNVGCNDDDPSPSLTTPAITVAQGVS